MRAYFVTRCNFIKFAWDLPTSRELHEFYECNENSRPTMRAEIRTMVCSSNYTINVNTFFRVNLS